MSMTAQDLNDWASFLRGKYGIMWPIATGTEPDEDDTDC